MIHWAKPKLVAEVAFAAWTADGMLRHASFQGIREDKNPREITLEVAGKRLLAAPASRPSHQRSRREKMASARATHVKTRQKSADVFAGVRLTHPDRVFFPDEGITKRDLAALLHGRCPRRSCRISSAGPSLWCAAPRVRRSRASTRSTSAKRCLKHCAGSRSRKRLERPLTSRIDDLAGLISLVQMGVLEIHPWGSRADRLDRPDRLIFDIDPADDLSWSDVVQAARLIKERLDDLGLTSFVRTTGGKGLHVVVPVARRTSWEDLKSFAKTFAFALVREQPSRYIAQSSKAKRAGKIYLDYLRNEEGATAIASYSTRARRGATVATPISWDELSPSLRPERFNTRTVPNRLRNATQDPWRGFFEIQQAITSKMQTQIDTW